MNSLSKILCLPVLLAFLWTGLTELSPQKTDLGSVATPPHTVLPVSDADQAKIRKMQLDDARISNAIQSRQLEIIELQKRRDDNAAAYQKFVAGVCGKDFVFSQENDTLSCVAKPKEKN